MGFHGHSADIWTRLVSVAGVEATGHLIGALVEASEGWRQSNLLEGAQALEDAALSMVHALHSKNDDTAMRN